MRTHPIQPANRSNALRGALAVGVMTLAASLIAFAAPPPKAALAPSAGGDASMSADNDMSVSGGGMAGRQTPNNSKGRALPKAQLDFFETKVRPLLSSKCYE